PAQARGQTRPGGDPPRRRQGAGRSARRPHRRGKKSAREPARAGARQSHRTGLEMNDVSRSTAEQSTPIAAEVAAQRRRKLRLPLMIGGVAVILAAALTYYLLHRRYESTEDAYVNAARVAISSDVPGRVVSVLVQDNQQVKRGDVLFRLDER